MADELKDDFVPITHENGRVTGMMDRATADYLASKVPDPTQESIDTLLRRITRVRVVPVTNYRKGETEQRTLLDTSDPASLASFRNCFAIVEDPNTFGHCMCLGDPHIELYVGDQLAATFGCHHGFAIRWNAWKHDAYLMEPDRLLDWMSAHGVDGPRREVEEMKRRGEEYRRHADHWREVTPDCFRPHWEQMGNSHDPQLHRLLLGALCDAFPGAQEQVLTLFGWFGSGSGPWSGYPAYESVPEQLLLYFPTQFLVDALTGSTPSETQWLGAARYFAGWDFRRNKNKDGKRLSSELKRQLLAAAKTTGIRDNIERAQRAFGN